MRNAICGLMAAAVIGAGVPMTLEQVSALSQANMERVQRVEADLAMLGVRIDGLERDLAAARAQMTASSSPAHPSALTPPAAQTPETDGSEARPQTDRPGEWNFTLTSIEPQDTSATRTEIASKLARAAELQKEAIKRHYVPALKRLDYVHEYNQRKRMKDEAWGLEREAKRLQNLVDNPPMLIRGLDADMREVICVCDATLTAAVKRLTIGEDVTVRGEKKAADTSFIEIVASGVVTR